MAFDLLAAEKTGTVWEARRGQVLAYLKERGFTPKAANLCFRNFVETMTFVARETGQVQFRVLETKPETLDIIEGILTDKST